MYESLTRYLPELNKASYGDWIVDKENDGSMEHPKQFPFVDYHDIVGNIWDEIYNFEKEHPDYKLTRYNDILARSGIKWETQSMKNADVSNLDGQTIMALLMAVTRAERFCDGAMLDFFNTGYIQKWIQRLKEIDDGKEVTSGLKSYDEKKNMHPAIVRYKGRKIKKFTPGKSYEAYFVEYWEGKRNSLHVRGDDGRITDFNPLEDFDIISDEDNLLNDYEAIVRCKTHEYEDYISGLIYGKDYKAIGRDREGLYLVMDESYCCYFYPPDVFEILDDPHGILTRRSVYYSYNGGDEVTR